MPEVICPLAEQSSSERNISVTKFDKEQVLCRTLLRNTGAARPSSSSTQSPNTIQGNWWTFRQS